MWNWRYAAAATVAGLMVAGGCLPDEYPVEPRFEVIPDEGPVGHFFQYNVLADVPVTSVNLAGSMQDPQWNMENTPMPNTWLITVDLPAGEHQYKFVFNGDGWASNMCDDPTWGDPANDNKVDPAVTECSGDGNAILELDQAETHTFLYVVPEGVAEITSVNLAGSFQGWNNTADPMRETYALWLDLEPGDYEYKFVFNGDQWAGNMCNDTNWGDPENDYMVDANGQGCADGGNATLTID